LSHKIHSKAVKVEKDKHGKTPTTDISHEPQLQGHRVRRNAFSLDPETPAFPTQAGREQRGRKQVDRCSTVEESPSTVLPGRRISESGAMNFPGEEVARYTEVKPATDILEWTELQAPQVSNPIQTVSRG
jgi:hypothetical protein